jgi:hypothetical protein
MSQVIKSLEEITTGYSVFEKDQVLTHDQLNSVADYFDDQTRLTRVKLLGVGILCGLRVAVQGSNVKITKGAGVTTDGDLLYFGADTVFNRFKLYDESNPVYGPLYVNNSMIKVYELVPQGATDPLATALSSFAANTGSSLNNMVAVLFMEGYVKDDDLCSGTDCDNLGKDFVNTTKLLLVDKASTGSLKKAIPTPSQAALALGEIVVDRPLFTSSITSPTQLGTVYRTACNSIQGKLAAEFPKLFPNCSPFLGEVFASDPSTGWISKLNTFNTTFAGSDSGIQYYYDFLKDLSETWNHFRELLSGETTWCCPDPDSFPKHLLLGNVVPGANPDENRTGLYPSPLTSRTTGQLDHARLLARKLNTLIQTFQTAPVASGIRVTPSAFEDRHTDERAIPFYYHVNNTNPVHKSWNFQLHERGMDAWNYSYNAAAYGAQGGAAHPLTSQLGRFSFFRVEGHLGQNVSTATATLKNLIAANNLPFTVRSVLLGTDKTKVIKPPIRYDDLHRFHYLLRQDAYYQLGDAVQFSGKFKQQVDNAVVAGTVTNDPADNDGIAVKDLAAEKHATVTTKASSAQNKLNRSYSLYQADTSWQADLGDTMKAGGEFKAGISKVVKTDFTTPFDSVIGSSHLLWLDWLDEIISQKDDQADDKLLFSNFVTEHPGIEHFAGVTRGGTFVLVYDTSNNVIADFMLPYSCCDETKEQPDEPVLTKPAWKPSWIIDNGIKINQSLDKYVNLKLDDFTATVIDPKINVQQDYFDFFKESWTTMTDVFGNMTLGGGAVSAGAVTKYNDPLLQASVDQTKAIQKKARLLQQKANDTRLPLETRNIYAQQAKATEASLAQTIQDTVKYVADSGTNMSAGTDAYKAMVEMSGSIGAITDAGTKETLKTGLTGIQGTADAGTFNVMLGNMIQF